MKLWQYDQLVSGISNPQAQERTTPDKWQPNTNTPQSNWQKAALYSVAALMPFVASFVNPNFNFNERTTPDKWYQVTSNPVFDYKRTQYLFPTFSIDLKQLTLKERTSVDKWYQLPNQPLFDAKRQQYTYLVHSANILPIEETADIQDAGIYQTPIPLFDAKRWQFLYPTFATDANSLTQHERITPDKWQPNTNLPLFDFKRAQYVYPNFVIDLSQLTQKERTTPDKWLPLPNQPLFDLRRQQITYPSYAANILPIEEPPTVQLAGINQTPVPYFPAKHTEYLFQVLGNDPNALTIPERITPDKWQPETNKPLFDTKRVQYLYPFQVQNLSPIEETSDIQLAGIRQTNIPYFRAPANQHLYLSFSSNPNTPQEIITVDKWHQLPPQVLFHLKRNQYLYPFFSIDSAQLTQKERSTADKWQPNTNQPLFDAKRQQYTYPSYFANILPIEEPDFFQDTGIRQTDVPYFPVKHAEYLFQTFTTDPRALTTKERATPDKWQPLPNQPLFDLRRWQFFYPSLSFNPFPIEEPAEVQDAGIYQTPVPYFPAATNQYLYPPFSIDTFQLTAHENIKVSEWFKETERPRFDHPRNQYLYPVSFFNPLPIEESETFQDAAIWQTNIPLFDAHRRQWLYPVFIVDPLVLTKAEQITLTKWFRETQQPFFIPLQQRYLQYFFPAARHIPLEYRDKYTTRNSAFTDKYSTRGTTTTDKYSSRGTTYGKKLSSLRTLDQQQTTTTDYPLFGVSTIVKVAQTFKPSLTLPIGRFEVFLSKVGTPSDKLQLQIYSDNAGVPGTLLATAANQLFGSSLLVGFANPTKCTFDFTNGPTLTSGTTYWAVLSRTGATDDTNFYRVFTSDDTPDKYTRGDMFYYNGSWHSFTADFGAGLYYDFVFNEYANQPTNYTDKYSPRGSTYKDKYSHLS